ncbi:zinc ABC transporter substrate-binding protein [Sanguibacter sp. YZGR15]|uniref:Zinc ABC transporter substrate-binding protein n=2 Tax=Sanguibacter suaedae TaxID=2795737 RepID=A0A934I373_9MICO|nr:zinc ABC transporter substrate-binding protein [Sanguibacter suaedae]
MPNFCRRRFAPRVLGAVLGATLLATATACATTAPSPRDIAGDRLLVVTTFTVVADMVRQVGREHVHVESVTKVGAEIHGYEPTPGDVARAIDADLVVQNGLGLEVWFDDFTARLDAPRLTLSDGIETVPVTRADTGGDPPPNPHAWMSPLVGARYAERIATALAELDPEHGDDYRANAREYADELVELHATLTAALGELPVEARVLATCEGAFSYLARDAGLDEIFLWPVNAEQQATPRRMESAIEAIRTRDVPAVFCETTVSSGPQEQVAREAGSAYGGELYVDSLSAADGPVPTYVDLLTYDVELVVAGLTGEEVDG